MLRSGDQIAIVANSDGLGERDLRAVAQLRDALDDLGLRHSTGLPLDREYGARLTPPTAHPAPDRVRAEHLMEVLENPDIAAVFDVSGGQLATGVLTHLVPDRLARSTGFFMGFSNLTTIANALYTAGGASSLLASPRVLGLNADVRSDFVESCMIDDLSTPARPGTRFVTPEVEFTRGRSMSGPVVGGNLGALLTLAGTPWFPSTDGAILALEALSPTCSTVAVGIHHLVQMGAFSGASGVLLGQFTAVEEEHGTSTIPQLVSDIVPDIPIATTRHFGHSADARAVMIGEPLHLSS